MTMGVFPGSRFNRSPLVYLSVMTLQFLQHTCFAGAGEIIRHPNSTHVPLGEEAFFDCILAAERVKWVIDGRTVFDQQTYEDMGYKFNSTILQREDENSEHERYLSLKFRATRAKNGTQVQCLTIQDGHTPSNIATLIVMGESSPPVPRLRPIDAARLILEWDVPFTWDQFPIHHYNVIVPDHREWNRMRYNKTSLEIAREPEEVTANECQELTFQVIANNELVDSEPGVITGGFPKVPTLTETPITEVVTFSTRLVPSVMFRIQLPHVCNYQTVEYTVSLVRVDSEEVIVSETTSSQRYGDGNTVEFIVEPELKADVLYTVTVAFRTFAEQSVEISEVLTVSKSFDTFITKPTVSRPGGVDQSDSGPLSTQVIIIISIVGGAVLIILLLVVAIIFMAALRRRRTIAVENIDGTPSHKRSDSLKRPPMVTNPIYEGPVYESIDPHLNRLNSSTPSTPTALLIPSPYANTGVDPTYIFPNNNLPIEDGQYTIMSAAGTVGKTIEEEPNNESNLDRDPSTIRYAPDPSGGTTIISEC